MSHTRIRTSEIDALTGGDPSRYAEHAVDEINYTEGAILDAIRQAEQHLADVRRSVERGQNIFGSPGWLSRVGAEIDVLVARRDAGWKMLAAEIGPEPAGQLAQRHVPEDERV